MSVVLSGARFICFDERMAGKSIGGRPIGILPDPWFGDFSPAQRGIGRGKYKFTCGDFVALTLGRQDPRKGFSFLLDVMDTALEAFPDLVWNIHGEVPENLSDRLARLTAKWGRSRVRVEQRFVRENDLPFLVAAADVVLLPYTREFTASSGILPRAAASGVPVLASDHGLVGYRTARFELGHVFMYGDAKGFLSALRALKQMKSEAWMGNLVRFSSEVNLEAFNCAVNKLI
jgi:glycosyltransferase involved in cell wall biosynthesis